MQEQASMGYSLIKFYSLLMIIFCVIACSTATPQGDRQGLNQIDVQVQALQLGSILPGAYFIVEAQGLLTGADITTELILDQQSITLENQLLTNGQLQVRMAIDPLLAMPEGNKEGILRLRVSLDQASGEADIPITFELRTTLAPVLVQMDPWSAPSTARALSGSLFLKEGEGESLLLLNGEIQRTQGDRQPLNLEIPLLQVTEDRNQAQWIAQPQVWGLSSGRVIAQAMVINRAHGGELRSPILNVELDYLPPQIISLGQTQISRGENLDLFGYGFVGQDSGYFTTVTFNGEFVRHDNQQTQVFQEYNLNTTWISGEHLTSYFNPMLNTDHQACSSNDLGGAQGTLSGELMVNIHSTSESAQGEIMPIDLKITGSKQVVYLNFLPAFTDSLRLFGLRNYSANIIDQVLQVVHRDYQGLNVEFRLSPPQDFSLYSVIEIGGPDPNSQSLFGLDNTTGLDTCNQRLDDYLAGVNADSGGLFGGVFVESFLRLSPTLGDSMLADPLFDEIFLPVIRTPAQVNEAADRMQVITLAIEVLGNLVGNTLSHELGHSLGLPVDPGCGSYHNAPGELQIMDCGQDRPFIERAGLDPRGYATWTSANRLYLETILPMP